MKDHQYQVSIGCGMCIVIFTPIYWYHFLFFSSSSISLLSYSTTKNIILMCTPHNIRTHSCNTYLMSGTLYHSSSCHHFHSYRQFNHIPGTRLLISSSERGISYFSFPIPIHDYILTLLWIALEIVNIELR